MSSWSPCCCNQTGGKVLFWFPDDTLAEQYPQFAGEYRSMTAAESIYKDMGVEVDYPQNWTHNFQDYSLVVHPGAIRYPSQWRSSNPPPIGWNARWHLTAENTAFPLTIDYVNALATFTGVYVIYGQYDCVDDVNGAVASDALTTGVPSIRHNCTSSVQSIGGFSTYYRNLSFAGLYVPWIARSVRRGLIWDGLNNYLPTVVEYVISGDWNHIITRYFGGEEFSPAYHNRRFLQNLYTVPIGEGAP